MEVCNTWSLNTWSYPKVDSPSFAAIVAAAAPLQHYQVDPVRQPLGLSTGSTVPSYVVVF